MDLASEPEQTEGVSDARSKRKAAKTEEEVKSALDMFLLLKTFLFMKKESITSLKNGKM